MVLLTLKMNASPNLKRHNINPLSVKSVIAKENHERLWMTMTLTTATNFLRTSVKLKSKVTVFHNPKIRNRRDSCFFLTCYTLNK